MNAAPRPSPLIPSTARSLPLAAAAKGARIFDSDGLDYIDASSGPLAVTLGHGHPRVLAAIADQFSAVDYVHRTQFRNSAAEPLRHQAGQPLGRPVPELAAVHVVDGAELVGDGREHPRVPVPERHRERA